MPDWISHILIALIISELCNIDKKSLVILGALLPDLLGKMVLFVNIFHLPRDILYWFFNPFHTPIGCVLVTFLIISFFKYNQRKAFWYITIGWVSHLLSDMLNKHILIGQNMFLFPLSWKNFEFGLIWAEQYYMALIPLSIIYLFILFIKHKKSKYI